MINMISQLVPQPVAGTGPPLTADRKLPEAVAAGEKSPEKAHPEVQGGSNKAPAEELTGALNQLNGYMEETHRSLRFSIDDDSGRTVVGPGMQPDNRRTGNRQRQRERGNAICSGGQNRL